MGIKRLILMYLNSQHWTKNISNTRWMDYFKNELLIQPE